MDEHEQTFEGFITKYALTRGIRKATLKVDGAGYASERPFSFLGFSGKSGWARTKEEAVKQAEAMRKKKIASLKKQIAKLEKLEF